MHTILIVDDEPNYQIVLTELLKDEGYEVFTADSGLAGLPIVLSTDLDLVLTDMKMPGMDGIEFLSKIKEYNRSFPSS
jgi:two-component system, NtrC family, response regulator